jgi:hypothetical protein
MHVFVKKKRSGVIKARKVAGGNKQRDFITKENASSPTVATESVLLTSMIDARENCDVAIVDITNAFFQTVVEDDKDKVIMRIRGHTVQRSLPKCTVHTCRSTRRGENNSWWNALMPSMGRWLQVFCII